MKWMYFGGSYNLMQLIIEEVMGEFFVDFMQCVVFVLLGMVYLSFELDCVNWVLVQYFGENGDE